MTPRNPPQPLPESLWGEDWQFAAIAATDLPDLYRDRPIPIQQINARSPLELGLPSDLAIPGVVINGGRRAMPFALWLQSIAPESLHSIPGEPDGLILFAMQTDRWILTTWENPEVRSASLTFEQRKQAAQGLHFLLVQPDDSGMTQSGFWLLQQTQPT